MKQLLEDSPECNDPPPATQSQSEESTTSTMRIRIQDLLLGVILLFKLREKKAPRAYTLNVVMLQNRRQHQSVTAPSHFGLNRKNRVVSSSNRISKVSGSTSSSLFQSSPGDGQERLFYNLMDAEMRTAASQTESIQRKQSNNKRNIVGIMAVLALFLVSQFVGNGAVTMAPSTTANEGTCFIFSAVSATLLRQQKSGSVSSSKMSLHVLNFQTLMLGILLWHSAHKVGHLIRLLTSWYMGVLLQFPLITKCVTTAVIGLLGDTAAQVLEERIQAKKNGRRMQILRKFDARRGLAVLGDGVLISGPLLHFAYNVLESIIPVAGPYASLAALIQVLIDDFVLDAIFVAIMFVTTGVAEGYTRQIIPQFRKDFFNTIKAGWVTSLLLMPLEFVCFRFLPLNFRVLGMNIIDIFWEAIISFMVHRRRRMSNFQEKELVDALDDKFDQSGGIPANAVSG